MTDSGMEQATGTADGQGQDRAALRLRWGALVMGVAACLPVAAQLRALAGLSAFLWLASMPLCILGAALVGQAVIARYSDRRREEEY